MLYSRLFGKTVRETSKDVTSISHKYLFQGGFIRESTAGRYYFLPLGIRVQNKIIQIIREEMNNAGAQELITPVLHPLELWEETNRTNTVGFELMVIKDRRGASFALGGTAEEMMVDLVRKFQISHKDLPFNIYQFSTKFRDELRARGGLLRVREFIMKDAYSFHSDAQDFQKEYKNMWDTYTRIYNRLGLKATVVEADNGYIGGEYCHEFVIESEAGESRFLMTEDGEYAAHEDVAKFKKYEQLESEDQLPRKDVEGVGIIGVDELAKFLKIPVEKTTKTILFENEKGQVIAAAINGIYDINETKLKNVLKCASLELASPETIKRVTGAEVGYAGILNLPKDVIVVMDDSLKNRTNFECGANKTNFHSININFGRDIPEPEKFYDIAMAQAGYETSDGKKLIEKKGIEVGNIFQLGYHYSEKMKNAGFVDVDGKEKKYYMGCYGIGIGRTLATVVEKHNDSKGIIWPMNISPYHVHLISLGEEKEIHNIAQNLHDELEEKNIEVLWDDRTEVTAGEKFNDADLIGIPIRAVLSKRSIEKGGVEVKLRKEDKTEIIKIDDLDSFVTNHIV